MKMISEIIKDSIPFVNRMTNILKNALLIGTVSFTAYCAMNHESISTTMKLLTDGGGGGGGW